MSFDKRNQNQTIAEYLSSSVAKRTRLRHPDNCIYACFLWENGETIKKIWKDNGRSSNSLFEPHRIVLNLKETSTPDRHLQYHLLESHQRVMPIFFLWTLVVTSRLFFLYYAKTFEHLKPAAGHVGTEGGVGWSDSPLLWKVSLSLFISLCFSVNVTAWFNNQAYHAIAVSLAAADAGILRSVLGKNVSMTTVNHPLPRTAQESINDLRR